MYFRWLETGLYGGLLHHSRKYLISVSINTYLTKFQLNTSRIGQNLVNISSSTQSSNPLVGLLKNLTKPLTTSIQNGLNNAASSFAKDLGLEDFYSAHILDHCEGFFTPGPVPNATLKASKIDRNVTSCSNRTSNFDFDPGAALQRTLDKSGTGVTLKDLGWPDELDKGIRALRTAVRATFALYCIAVGFALLAALAFAFWMFGPSTSGRGVPLAGAGLAFVAFMAMGIASAIVTSVAVKGDNIIDKYGKKIGVEAARGNGYLALTWAGTACLFLASIVGCFGCCLGRKRRVKTVGEK
jgi:hypothetical protein